jgi:uncharacterized 2Fe-2S/4Fe-4S cluster protein (DUF4445 family)
LESTRHVVTFLDDGVSIEVPAGTTLRDAAALGGVALPAPCGGLGTCGRCRVRIQGYADAPTSDEIALLTPEQLEAGERLSCRAGVAGDVTVSAAGERRPSAVIVDTFTDRAFEVEPPAARGISGTGPLLGAVIDVGTTTMVARLIDLTTGEAVASVSALNPQAVFGADVMSRISAADVRGVDAVRAPLAAVLHGMVERLVTGHGITGLRELAICGNPTMMHILLGIDPQPLGVAPYRPAYEGAVETSTSAIGLVEMPDTPVFVMPAVSAFIGSDIVAGLLATDLDGTGGTAMLIDLGTNGELVLRTADGLVGASTAAGPALEGAAISSGMLARTGAIERVAAAEGDLELAVIGGGEPKGICGSGLIDLMSVLLESGVLDETGRMLTGIPGPIGDRVREEAAGRSFEVAPGVRLTQQDVRQVQLAVAAVAAGVGCLLDEARIPSEAVEHLVVAGGFGLHVNAGALERLGLIPAGWARRVSFAGNTALSGSVAALVSGAARRRASALAAHVRTVDLATRPDFQRRFIAGMTFPRS